MSSFQLLTSFRYDPRLRAASWNAWPSNSPSPFFLLPFHLERIVGGARHFGWTPALETLGMQDGAGEVYPIALERFSKLCEACVDAYVSEHPECSAEQALKIRITLSCDGVVNATASPTPSRPYDLLAASTLTPASLDLETTPRHPAPTLRVVLDTQPTSPSQLIPYKTTSRAPYDAARARAGIPPLLPAPSTSPSSGTFTSTPASPPPPTEVLLYTPATLGSPALIIDASIRTPFFYRSGRWTTPRLAPAPAARTCAEDPSSRLGTPLAGTVRRFLLASGCAVEGDVEMGRVVDGEWVLLCNAVEGCVVGRVERGGRR